jgi:hypothetical protein
MSKKVLSLVLALVMVLGSFSFVSAASYTDVTGEAADAVGRLSLLGILEGYPDGTFKPEGEITRAEFAAVAVRAKGLASAAAAAQGLPTGFTDVPGTFWASGVVGTAARLGIVNGVGNGLFAPQSPVKYEDAITMLVRALGYEESAKAKGGYPYGYLIVANEIGLLDAVKGTQGAPATRGIVAQMTDNALEIEMMIQVGYGTDTKWVVSGTENTEEKYLLDELGFESVKGRVVSVNTKTDKLVVDPTDEDLKNVTLEVAEGFDFYSVEGLETKFWYKDDVVVIYVVNEEAKFDAVEVDDDEITLITEDENYEVARNATLTVDGKEVKQDKFNADYAKIVLNDDDEIIWAQGYTLDGFILVEEVEDEVALSYDDYDEVDLEDFTVVKDGKTIAAEEIEEQDILFFNNDEEFAVVANKGTEGELDRVYTDGSFRFEGEGYTQTTIGNAVALYFDEGKIGELDADILDEFLDDEATITVYVDFAGKAVVVSGEVSSAGNSSYGVLLENPQPFTGRRGNMIALDLRNGADEKVSYDISINDIKDKDIKLTGIRLTADEKELEDLRSNKISEDVVLKITLDKDGDISAIELPDAIKDADAFEIDDSNVKADGVSYRLQASTIVFHDGNDEATTLGNAKDKFEEVKANSTIYVEKGRVIAVVGETDADADTKSVTGLVTKVINTKSDKVEFTVKVFGATQRLVTEFKDDADDYDYVNEIVTFKVGETSGEIKDVDDNIKVATNEEITITKVSGRTISSEEWSDVELNTKAVIYDAADKFETLNLRDLEPKMVVTVYFQGSSNRFVDYVVVNGEGNVDDPEVKADGKLTEAFDVDNDVTIVIDGKAYDVRDTAVKKDKENALLTDEVLTPETKVSFTLVEGTSQVFTLKVEDRTIADINALEPVENAIEDLPKVADLTVAHEDAVNNAKLAYEDLTATQRKLVQSANKAKLDAAVAKMEELVGSDGEAKTVRDLITAFGTIDPSDNDDRAKVSAAREAYDDLSSAAKKLVNNYANLVTAENTIVVYDAKEDLDVKYASGDSEESVTKNVTLVSKLKGADIYWNSDAPTVVTATGSVTRPAADTEVTLTATIVKGGVSDTATFTLTVKAAE